MQSKNFAVNVKAAGPDDGLEEGRFTAYASVFGNVDSYGDVVQPGAFAKSIAKWAASSDVAPVLWGHDTYDPFSNIGSVLEMSEDDHGLLVKGQIDTTNPKAEQVYKLMKGRRINQLSFAYDVVSSDQGDQDGEKVLNLRELDLFEVSIVPYGANAETEILAVKANAHALADGLKAGRAISSKNESELRKAYDAIGGVLAALEPDDQEKASGNVGAHDEEPPAAKSPEPRLYPSVDVLASLIQIEERKTF